MPGQKFVAKSHVGEGAPRAPSNLPPVALALTLCDSLRDAAYDERWSSMKARAAWKELIVKPGASLAEFGSHMRFFEARLSRAAFTGRTKACSRACCHLSIYLC